MVWRSTAGPAPSACASCSRRTSRATVSRTPSASDCGLLSPLDDCRSYGTPPSQNSSTRSCEVLIKQIGHRPEKGVALVPELIYKRHEDAWAACGVGARGVLCTAEACEATHVEVCDLDEGHAPLAALAPDVGRQAGAPPPARLLNRTRCIALPQTHTEQSARRLLAQGLREQSQLLTHCQAAKHGGENICAEAALGPHREAAADVRRLAVGLRQVQ